MKSMKSLFIAVILCITTVAQADDGYVFKVLASKGASEVNSDLETSWRPVKTGATLQSGDQLKVSEDAYIGLVHVSGRTIEITASGSVSVDDLAAELQSQSASATSKYADFVLNKLSENENARRDELQVTGAVERKLADPNSISVAMPLISEVFESNVWVQWEGSEDVEVYEVTIKNVFDEVIFNQMTTGNALEINLNQTDLASQRLLILNVAAEGNDKVKSENYGVKRISDIERDELEAKIQEVTINSPSSLSEIMKASLYEQHNLLVDAATSYQRAIKLSPQVEDFQRMYDAFKDRNHLK